MADTTNPHDPKHGHSHDPLENPDVSFERTDVDFFQITAFGIGLLIATVVVAFAIIALFNFFAKHEDAKNPPPIASMMKERPGLAAGAASAARTRRKDSAHAIERHA